MARIVLKTFGSFGDVHPYLALAIELQRRRHECVIATSEVYRQKITAEGVGFVPVRPDVGELLNQPELISKLWHPTKGTVYLLRDYLLPKVEQGYEDLKDVCEEADLLLTHGASYAGPVVAAALQMRWMSVALQPAIFFSTYDPMVIAAAPWARHLYPLGRWVFASMMRFANWETRRWAKPVYDLRKRLKIDNDWNPVMDGQFSPFGTLTLFSSAFAGEQLDWPPNSKPTGFVFYDKRGEGFGLPPETATGISEGLRKFLLEGPPPVLFTLGSSAVTDPGTFYSESVAAAKQLGMRAVLLTGRQPLAAANAANLHIEEYASYSAVMPLVSAVVHQGGIGTVAQTLRAGKPMIVVPWSHDQPDNAYRLRRMGAARVIPRKHYAAHRAARELRTLLQPGTPYAVNAARVAAAIKTEDGLTAACKRIERILKN